MIIRKTSSEILRDMLDRLPKGYDKQEGGLFYDNMAPISIEMEKIFDKLEYIFKNSFAETAEGIFLDYIVQEVGLDRRQANKAIGSVTITGNPGTTISKGVQVSSESYIFITTEEKVVGDAGAATVAIEAIEGGRAYNLPAEAIDSFPVTNPGLQTVTNSEETRDGYDAETDEELRTRYYFKVRNPVTSGNIYHYKKWCMEVEGVGGVKVFPLWEGPGTVKCVITNKAVEAAPPELIQRVADYVESVRPIGADVTIASAEGKNINVTAKVLLSQNTNLEGVKTAFGIEANKYLKEIGFIQDYVSYAKLGKILLTTSGVLDYRELKVNGNVVNIPLADDEVPLLGSIELSEEKEA